MSPNLKNPLKLLTVLFILALALPSAANADKEQQCRADIQLLLNSYQQALNDSAINKVVPLYTDDGIFMPSKKPTAVGEEQVRVAYQHVFKALDLNVKFHIDEIEHYGDIAFVRTTSDGEIKLLEKNITIKNNSRELFILKRTDSKWKIYRYMFNEMS
jgi:uncharacterized protein (TIGR02246 family)